jgi:hypothetical protein
MASGKTVVIVTLSHQSITISNGMARVRSPMTVPRRKSVTGLRLCSGILTEGEFALGYITERGAENDDDAGQACEADEGEADVRAREDGPGLHLCFVTGVIVAGLPLIVKGGKPPKQVG